MIRVGLFCSQILNHRQQDPTGLITKALDFNVKARGFCIDERKKSPMWIPETDLSPSLFQPWEGSALQYYWANNFRELFFIFLVHLRKKSRAQKMAETTVNINLDLSTLFIAIIGWLIMRFCPNCVMKQVKKKLSPSEKS